jgi:NCS2 family nucleobase:cation symporter-2
MRKPHGVIYGVDERPPAGVIALSSLQHVGVMSVFLIYPVLIGRAADSTPDAISNLVNLSLIVLAIGTVLQALPRGPVGSGYLCQPVPTAIYLIPSLLAARTGGLPLVFGMTVLAGLVEIALSRLLRALRPLFPPEIAGLVVALMGVATGVVAIRLAAGAGVGRAAGSMDVIAGGVTLATMVALNVWAGGSLRLCCVLIGMIAGYVTAAALGILGAGDWQTLTNTPWIAAPSLDHAGWDFDAALVVPFAVGAVAASLKVVGNVTTSQKLNDADWVRTDMGSVSRGILADGLATTLAGAVGTSGVNSASANVGMANATGVMSRNIAYSVAAFLLLLAFFPKLGVVFTLMPRAVAGMALLFAAAFIFVNGVEIMTMRLLDARKTFVIGFAFIGGLAVELLPRTFADAPVWMRSLLVSSLVVGPVLALLLNAVLRLGVRKVQKLAVEPAQLDPAAVQQFMETHGAAWGARRDVIERASFNLHQSLETIVEGCDPRGPLEVTASFDEFNLDIRVSYEGAPLELPERRPTNEEIMESEEGQRRLAGFMLRRYADRVAATHRGGRSTILFHFDH